jgi:beta-phosphoglucomutase-like phosphatase (HAD superfamily)
MARTQGIVFDTDGVLIDSEELHAHAKRIAFAHAGIALSDADLRSYVGRSDAVMIDEIGARYGLTDGQRPRPPEDPARPRSTSLRAGSRDVDVEACAIRLTSHRFVHNLQRAMMIANRSRSCCSLMRSGGLV